MKKQISQTTATSPYTRLDSLRQIADDQYKEQLNTPTKGETYVKAAKTISGGISPDNAFQPALAGFAAGAGAAADDERRANMDSRTKVNDWFKDIINTTGKRIEQLEQYKMSQKSMIAPLSLYARNLADGSYQNNPALQENDLRRIVEFWNDKTGENLRVDPGSPDPYRVLQQSKDGEYVPSNILAMVLPEQAAMDVANFLPSAQQKEQHKQNVENAELGIKELKVNQDTPGYQALVKQETKLAENDAEIISKEPDVKRGLEKVIETVDNMTKLANENKSIFTSDFAKAAMEIESDNWLTAVEKKLGRTMTSKKDQRAISLMKKYTNQLKTKILESLPPNVKSNMSIDNMISSSVPSVDQTFEAFLAAGEDIKATAEKDKGLLAKEFEGAVGRMKQRQAGYMAKAKKNQRISDTKNVETLDTFNNVKSILDMY